MDIFEKFQKDLNLRKNLMSFKMKVRILKNCDFISKLLASYFFLSKNSILFVIIKFSSFNVSFYISLFPLLIPTHTANKLRVKYSSRCSSLTHSLEDRFKFMILTSCPFISRWSFPFLSLSFTLRDEWEIVVTCVEHMHTMNTWRRHNF